MKELERRSGLPRTTIHLYLREGLLQPPDKTAPNTGVYNNGHVDRLDLIQRLRSPEAGKLSLPRIRRILDRVEKGVSVQVAIQLEAAVTFTVPSDRGVDADRSLSLPEVSRESGVPEPAIEEMVKLGLLIPDPFGRGGGFNRTDAAVAKASFEAFTSNGLELMDAAPIVAHLSALSRYEMELRNRAVTGITGEENALVSLSLRNTANLLHHYLLSRTLEREIAKLASKKPQPNSGGRNAG